MIAQPRYDRLFGSAVGLRHDIHFAFVINFHRAREFSHQNRARFARCFYRYVQVGIHHVYRNRAKMPESVNFRRCAIAISKEMNTPPLLR
jgi:hypothetical protein